MLDDSPIPFGYFGDLSGVFTAPMDAVPQPDRRYVAGLDFGQTNDYTSLSVLDAAARVQVDRLRIGGLINWTQMRRQVVALCMFWDVTLLLVEANSMGGANIEAILSEMDAAGCTTALQAFGTTAARKQAIIVNLHEALHSGLRLQDDPVQRHELNAFRATRLPSGSWRLSAPEGEHDDTVISLALSWEAVSNNRIYGGINV